MSLSEPRPLARNTLLHGASTSSLDQALEGRAGREITAGLVAAGAFLLALLGWGSWARLDSAVTAQGQVEVSGERQAVQHRDGGIVSELDVHEGQRVAAGQVLLRLNAAELQANVRATSAQVIELQALQARLAAELLDRPTIAFPSAFARLTGDDRAAAEAAMAQQQREFDARRAALASDVQVLGQRQREASEQITGYKRQVAANLAQQALIQQELNGVRALQKRGLVPDTRVRGLERNAAELDGSEGEYSANIAKTEEEIGEDRIRISDLQKQRASDASKDAQSAEYQLADLQPKLAALREQLARTEVRAPASGRVVDLKVFTVGGVVAPGQKLMDIVPDRRPLVIEARVKPEDVADLHRGQQAEIRIPAFHDRGLPTLHGAVSNVSADALTDERSGSPYFRVQVTLPPEEEELIEARRGAQGGLHAGLPVSVLIPSGRRTALDYLIQPLRQTLWGSFHER